LASLIIAIFKVPPYCWFPEVVVVVGAVVVLTAVVVGEDVVVFVGCVVLTVVGTEDVVVGVDLVHAGKSSPNKRKTSKPKYANFLPIFPPKFFVCTNEDKPLLAGFSTLITSPLVISLYDTPNL
jgi:hypothetical protein